MGLDTGGERRTPMTPAHVRVRRAFRRTRCTCGLSWPCPDRERDERPIPDGEAARPPGP
ncbi:hypothetical protein Asp14428_72920 [Actinoplanes sp. NBRC 14428]|uniref:Uncharacterized protein n=1 Tax=Pseudosporangium ferrugineum TaxID=439699 RepID=A0A2T0S1Y4_9ACTN|nr:hypothetical protein [Pseudosporangium ferrugineum]PRY27425.1 hypothetical protein CLV70_11010 [Pseudosporangium ferrugineum]BCJ55817.1 hypothetical protein Asp14428_72920 [Actinoplanes sp. NBRC 14428]